MGDIDTVPLVHSAADITAAWCDAALRPRLGAARVVAARTDPVGTGQVADTVRIHLEYDPPGAGPATLVAKVPSADETSRAGAAATRTYEVEASFYRDLAGELPVRTPECWYAAHDMATNAYVVVLEDVAPAVQGDQMRGCPVGDIAAAVDELALLHGPRWGDPTLAAMDWPRRPTPEGMQGTSDLITWAVESFKERYTDRLEPATVALVERFMPRLRDYVAHPSEPWTVVHGDFRADNLLFGGPRVVVVDWQTVALGAGPSDLAYLLGASLLPEVRREHEGALVDRYVDALHAQGVTVARETVWTQYRRYAFGGLIMAIVAQALVRRTDRGDEMFITMADRHSRQVLDLDSESLLG